jgi:hypothetical protein
MLNWNKLAYGRHQQRDAVNTVINFHVPYGLKGM